MTTNSSEKLGAWIASLVYAEQQRAKGSSTRPVNLSHYRSIGTGSIVVP